MTITIKLIGDKLVPFLGQQDGKKVTVKQGDVIRWESPEGPVTIKFRNESPFGDELELPGSTDRTVIVEGRRTFSYECGVTKGDTTIGWPGTSAPGSGGEIEVVRRPMNP